MSWQATNWVIEHSRHKGSALLVMMCIANCANEDGSDAFPSGDRLARDTRLTRRQVLRIIDKLEQSGEIAVRRSAGRLPNHYAFPLMNSEEMSPLAKKRTPEATVTFQLVNGDISDINGDISTPNQDIAMSHDPSIERSTDPPEEPSPKRQRRKSEDKGARIPEPFMLTAKMKQWARDEGITINIDKATREFVDYWRGVPGQKGKKLDWEATWRNRMRELNERGTYGQNGRSAQRRTVPSDDFVFEPKSRI